MASTVRNNAGLKQAINRPIAFMELTWSTATRVSGAEVDGFQCNLQKDILKAIHQY